MEQDSSVFGDGFSERMFAPRKIESFPSVGPARLLDMAELGEVSRLALEIRGIPSLSSVSEEVSSPDEQVQPPTDIWSF